MTVISQQLEDKKREHGAPLIQSNAEEKPVDIESNNHERGNSTRTKAKCWILLFLAVFILVELIKFLTYEYIFEEFEFPMSDRSERESATIPEDDDLAIFLYSAAHEPRDARIDAELSRIWNVTPPAGKQLYQYLADKVKAMDKAAENKRIDKSGPSNPTEVSGKWIATNWKTDDLPIRRMYRARAVEIVNKQDKLEPIDLLKWKRTSESEEDDV